MQPNTPLNPETNAAQRVFRKIIQPLLRGWLRVTTHLRIEGLHNFPSHNAAILAFNHLGHFDILLIVAFSPRPPEFIALADLLSVPVTSAALRAYGIIPVQRDEYDRRVIRAALDVLDRGELLALAPEARQSPTAALEKGREGAAYLALKSNAPIVPVGFTGTQNVYSAWRNRHRPAISMTVGEPFHIPAQPGLRRREKLEAAHRALMLNIAQLLPVEYRGYWKQPS